ncbi:MAG: 3,4-dehydroadipyl-CoA semialdehyde dehydrogenase, partial [Burkholderiaceae bacterium]
MTLPPSDFARSATAGPLAIGSFVAGRWTVAGDAAEVGRPLDDRSTDERPTEDRLPDDRSTDDRPTDDRPAAAGWAALHSAIDGRVVARASTATIDFEEALAFARERGRAGLMALDFQQRAARLRALARWLLERKEVLYQGAAEPGATRSDSWIDIEGGIATLSAYAATGASDLPSGNVVHEGPVVPLGRKGGFVGSHILVPRAGVAVHINAFNFPVWGMLENFAPTFVAGMPCLVKPATSTSFLAFACARLMVDSGILPEGALQLVIGNAANLLDRLGGQDVVKLTGSATTAAKLRTHPNLVARGVTFSAEADSLNCAILAPDVEPDHPEFGLFIDEVVLETTVKAGQKCTAIRRVLVPRRHLDVVTERLRQAFAATVVGDPAVDGVRMGPLASRAQQDSVAAQVARLAAEAELVIGGRRGGQDGFAVRGEGVVNGAFFEPTLLLARDPHSARGVHDIEAFGPVTTAMPYVEIEEAIALAARGRGSLVGSV